MLKGILTLVIVLSIFITVDGCMYKTIKESSPNHDLKAGQIWKYKNRPGEDDSVIRILKIEHYDKFGALVHISIENLRLTNADNKNVTFQTIGHMVFDEKSIKDSVTELVKENDTLPDFKESYNAWRKSFDQGITGISSESVAYTLSVLEEIMN